MKNNKINEQTKYLNDDEVLSNVYLFSKKIDNFRDSFIVNNERFYFINGNIILRKSLDTSIPSFSLYNLDAIGGAYDTALEIFVNPEKANIVFNSAYKGKITKRFDATFDGIDECWDVRSYISENRKLTSLSEALEELESLDKMGELESNCFKDILTVVCRMMNKDKEKDKGKTLKKVKKY